MPSKRGLERRRELLCAVADLVFGPTPTTWAEAARTVHVPSRTLRRWRAEPLWAEVLGELESEVGERERVAKAKAVLAAGMYDPDPHEARRCARDYLQIVAARTSALGGGVKVSGQGDFAAEWWAQMGQLTVEQFGEDDYGAGRLPEPPLALPKAAAEPEPEPRETVAS